MKLTKKAIQQLNEILRHIERSEKFIYKESTLVCIKTNSNISTVYKNKQNDMIQNINKYYGSNLVGIHDAKTQLKDFISLNL